MKESRICIIATIITSLILILTASLIPVSAGAAPETPEYYSKLVAVKSSVKLETSIWIVSCQDKNGNIWEFLNNTGELEQGDILTLLMITINGREEKDECVEYMYEGHVDNLDLFFEMIGWR